MKDDYVTIHSLSLSHPAEGQLRAIGWLDDEANTPPRRPLRGRVCRHCGVAG